MNHFKDLKKLEHLALFVIIGLAAFITFIPHFSYPYPIHLDEWLHWAAMNKIVTQSSLVHLTDPFTGGPANLNQTFELGFHIFWTMFHELTGLPWQIIFLVFPTVTYIFTVLCAYILGRRLGFGWEAALFASLVPTTVGTLGPAFFVPAAFVLPFLLLLVYIVFFCKTQVGYALFVLFAALVLLVHGPSYIILGTILIPYFIINFRYERRRTLMLIGLILLPPLIGMYWGWGQVVALLADLRTYHPLLNYVYYPSLPKLIGPVMLSVVIFGSFTIVMKGSRQIFGLFSGTLLLVMLLAVYFWLGRGLPSVALRSITVAYLFIAFIAGAGLHALRGSNLPKELARRKVVLLRGIAWVVTLAIIGLVLFQTIPLRLHEPYYHMIDQTDWTTFQWIKENVPNDGHLSVLDPWAATAFSAVTGRYVYGHTTTFAGSKEITMEQWLERGCKDSQFLIDNTITLVYTRGPCNNPDLVQVHQYVYLFKGSTIEESFMKQSTVH